jgi:hypothetical protein
MTMTERGKVHQRIFLLFFVGSKRGERFAPHVTGDSQTYLVPLPFSPSHFFRGYW